ncbi:hypothetical protein AB0H76_09730 [Nocardia sp. NPDC050712]|uniref:hypothetical protein n=1 Tax=Nocardia sp. NPDC050712 TaxID=3155518 RepID=UPI0034021C07
MRARLPLLPQSWLLFVAELATQPGVTTQSPFAIDYFVVETFKSLAQRFVPIDARLAMANQPSKTGTCFEKLHGLISRSTVHRRKPVNTKAFGAR